MKGKHRAHPSPLCRAPLNEDVFTPPGSSSALSLDSDIQELSEQIHRLLLQVGTEDGMGGSRLGGKETEAGWILALLFCCSLCTAPAPLGFVESALWHPQVLFVALAPPATAMVGTLRGLGLLLQ